MADKEREVGIQLQPFNPPNPKGGSETSLLRTKSEHEIKIVTEIPLQETKRTGPGRLIDIVHKTVRYVIAIMSGTSADGLDIVYLKITGRGSNAKVELIAFASFPYSSDFRKRILRLRNPETARIDEVCQMNFVLGEVWAAFILQFMLDKNISANEVDLIATAGQTLWHSPNPSEFWLEDVPNPIVTGSTFAIGESAVIAERTGILTIGDLRLRDVAAGGQGAPLIPYADWMLLRDLTIGRAVQNYGGIANVTYLPPNCGIDKVVAFDTGPGNMLIDQFARLADGSLECDIDGRLAAKGLVIQPLLEELLRDPYFHRKPPKTTGFEYFGEAYGNKIRSRYPNASLLDLIATVTALTAESVAMAYQDFIVAHGRSIQEVIVGGGGPKNPTLMRMQKEAFERRIGAVTIKSHEDFGIPNQAKEALAIGIIGDDGAFGMTTNVKGATGGKPTILGKISY